MYNRLKIAIAAVTVAIFALMASAQAPDNKAEEIFNQLVSVIQMNVSPDSLQLDSIPADSIVIHYESVTDSLLQNVTDVDTLINLQPLPKTFFLPAVFSAYTIDHDTLSFKSDYSGLSALRWLEDALALDSRQRQILRRVSINHPTAVKYNVWELPEAVKVADVVINPDNYTVEVDKSIPDDVVVPTVKAEEVEKKHWLKTFTGNLQFSQAYVSPNWYQGGNNNLNMLLDLNYNVKLNPKFHPTLLFETNVQYKLGLYSAPDDSLRSYNLSQDLLQINSTFGIKAIQKWYYTVNAQFKTQLFDSYTSNTNNLRSALLSPGELNIGLGMTYNTANARKTFTLDASISPLSYNLMICTSDRMNRGAYGIKDGHKTSSKYGSSCEVKIGWKLTTNIRLNSRLFAFTDYDRAYADLENTMVFEINKYLTTQIFVHMRYDTNTPYIDPGWHKLQIKEILSMGFTYKFSTI